MRAASRRPVQYTRPFQEIFLSAWLLVPLALLLGGFIALQFFAPTPRYVKLLFGLVFLFTVTKFPLYLSLSIFMVIFVAPTFIFIGDTNVIFIGFLTVIWVSRMGLGWFPRPVQTPVTWAILLYLLVHIVSFLNIDSAEALSRSIEIMVVQVAGVMLFVLLINGVRTQGQLLTLLNALCLTAALVNLTGLVEYIWTGYQLIPEWFLYKGGQSVPTPGRVGAIFGSHALLSDWSAMLFYVEITLGMRSQRKLAKLYYYGLAFLALVMISLTVNRGGAIIWVLGGLYYLWLMRHRIRWMRMAIALPTLGFLWIAFQLFSGRTLRNLGVFVRLAETQLERGVPETRVKAWSDIMARIPEHLWFGHGPYYDLRMEGTNVVVWPHSAYLFYLYSTGVAGLLVWLWILLKLVWKSFPGWRVDFVRWDLPRAFLAVGHILLLMFAAAQVRSDHQRGNVYVYFMWILFALVVICWRLVQEERRTQIPSRA